jgi:predicted  nucleic acid-binding Zn-ribbon protein
VVFESAGTDSEARRVLREIQAHMDAQIAHLWAAIKPVRESTAKFEEWHGGAINGAWLNQLDERYALKDQLATEAYAKAGDLQALQERFEKGVTEGYTTKMDFDTFKASTEQAVKTVAGMTERVNQMEQEFRLNASQVLDKCNADTPQLTLQAQSANMATSSASGSAGMMNDTRSALTNAFTQVYGRINEMESKLNGINEGFEARVHAGISGIH